MRHGSTAARQLPIYFIRNLHKWVDFSNGHTYVKVKCEDCGLTAIQDQGSLLYFVVEGDSDIASLSCDQLIIKNIIE